MTRKRTPRRGGRPADRNETFYHKPAGAMSEKLMLTQLLERQREEEEKKLFQKTRVKDIVP